MINLGFNLRTDSAAQALQNLASAQRTVKQSMADVILDQASFKRLMTDISTIEQRLVAQGHKPAAEALRAQAEGWKAAGAAADGATVKISASIGMLQRLAQAQRALEREGDARLINKASENKGSRGIGLGLESLGASTGVAKTFSDLSNALTGVEPATKKAGQGALSFASNLNGLRFSASLTKEMLASLFGTVTTALAVRETITQFSAFEYTLAQIRAATGATDLQMQMMEDTARNLGVTTQYSAVKAADGLLILARAGFTTQEAISAIKPVLNLATAAHLDMGSAALYVSSALKQFHLSAAQTEPVADALLTVANKTTTDVRELGEALKMVGPSANAARISLNETLAALGVLAENGIRGTLAGTALRAVLDHLADPTAKATKTIRELNLGLDQLNPTTNKVIDILQALSDANFKLTDATSIAGRRASSNLIALSQGAASYKGLLSAIEQGTGVTQRTADLMGNTLQGSMERLRATITEVAIAIGRNGLGGSLTYLANAASDALHVIIGVDTATRSSSIGVALMTTAINTLVTALAIGLAVGGVASIAKMVIEMNRLYAAARASHTAMTALFAVATRNPFGLITIGVSLLVASVISLVEWLRTSNSALSDTEKRAQLFKQAMDRIGTESSTSTTSIAQIRAAAKRGDTGEQLSGMNAYLAALKSSATSAELVGGPTIYPEDVKNAEAQRTGILAARIALEKQTREFENTDTSDERSQRLQHIISLDKQLNAIQTPKPVTPYTLDQAKDLLALYPDLTQSAIEMSKVNTSMGQSGLQASQMFGLLEEAIRRTDISVKDMTSSKVGLGAMPDIMKNYGEEVDKLRDKLYKQITQQEVEADSSEYTKVAIEAITQARKAGLKISQDEEETIIDLAKQQIAYADTALAPSLELLFTYAQRLEDAQAAHKKLKEAQHDSQKAAEDFGKVLVTLNKELAAAGLKHEDKEKAQRGIDTRERVQALLNDPSRAAQESAQRGGLKGDALFTEIYNEQMAQINNILALTEERRIRAESVAKAEKTAHKKLKEAQHDSQKAAEDFGKVLVTLNKELAAAGLKHEDKEKAQRGIDTRERVQALLNDPSRAAQESAQRGGLKGDALFTEIYNEQMAQINNILALTEERRIRAESVAKAEKTAREELERQVKLMATAAERVRVMEETEARRIEIIPEIARVTSEYGLAYRAAREDAAKIVEYEQTLAKARGTTISNLGPEGVERVNQYAEMLQYMRTIERVERAAAEGGREVGDMFTDLIMKTKSWNDALESTAMALEKIILTEAVSKPISGLFGSLFSMFGMGIAGMFGGSPGGPGMSPGGPGGVPYAPEFLGGMWAKGGAFSGGAPTVVPFAMGTIVNSPTMFPMPGRKIGLMGERGREGILPLFQGPQGLGIRDYTSHGGGGSGSQPINVTQNVYANDPGGYRRSSGQMKRGLRDMIRR